MKIKERIQNCFKKAKKLVLSAGAAVVAGVSMAVSSFAAGETPNAQEAVTAATTVLGSVTAVLNITNIASILAACMGSATLLFLAWWGVRKVTKVTVRAFSHGKLSI